jgi:methylthioribose-1-phosphate isomerase
MRMSRHVAKKIKAWALDFEITPSEYLDSVVPDVKIEEGAKCQQNN